MVVNVSESEKQQSTELAQTTQHVASMPAAEAICPPLRPVTLKDVAARCGVHVMTVSRALRHDRANLSEETIARICAIAREMGYNRESNHAARRLVAQRRGEWVRTRVLALFYPPYFAEDVYASRIFQGMMRVLIPADYTLLLVPTYDPSQLYGIRKALPSSFCRGEVDGVLALAEPGVFSPLLSQLRQERNFAQRPVITLMSQVAGASCVRVDDQYGAYLAAKHLLSLGHRDMLHTWPLDERDSYFGPTRYAGFCQAYQEFGIDPKGHLHSIPWINGILDYMERTRLTLMLALEQHPETTAIMTTSDHMARSIFQILTEDGIRVPEDISLMGFDDTYPMQQMNGQAFLSTITSPLDAVGREAAQLMLRMLDGDAGQCEQVVLPGVDLIARASTGLARTALGHN